MILISSGAVLRHPDLRPLWTLIVLVAACALVVPNFFAWNNFANVLRVAAILALASYGQAIVIITGGIDFSLGSSVALGSIATVLALQSMPLEAAFLMGFVAMVLTGAVNGFLIGWIRLPPFLATLGMLLVLHGIASVAVGGLPVEAPVSVGFYSLSRSSIFSVPMPVLLAAAGGVALHLLLTKTVAGRSFYLTGANTRAARLAGVNVTSSLWLAYTYAAVFIAIAGLVLTSRVASGQPNLMPNLPFETIAACAIGGVRLTGGRGSALQVVVGVLIISALNNAIVLLNLPAAAQLGVLGMVMVVAVFLQSANGNKALSRAMRRFAFPDVSTQEDSR